MTDNAMFPQFLQGANIIFGDVIQSYRYSYLHGHLIKYHTLINCGKKSEYATIDGRIFHDDNELKQEIKKIIQTQ